MDVEGRITEAGGSLTTAERRVAEVVLTRPELVAFGTVAELAEAAKAGLKGVSLPTCNVAGETVATGAQARCFASYMRIHALEASGGQTYSQMGRYATKDGKGTNDAAAALQSSSGQPLDNPGRNVWISETALSTALNVSYMADQLALFGVVVGIALLLSGIGFIVLAAYGMVRIGATAVKPVAAQAGTKTPATI